MDEFDFGIMTCGSVMIGIIIFLFGLIVFACGHAANEPTELENECIVHNDKLYCEVRNIEKGE